MFVGTLRDQAGISLFVAFGFALLFTMGALLAFLTEMLLASRGIRDLAASATEDRDAAEPLREEGDQSATGPREGAGLRPIQEPIDSQESALIPCWAARFYAASSDAAPLCAPPQPPNASHVIQSPSANTAPIQA
jgi:hypothetical protein